MEEEFLLELHKIIQLLRTHPRDYQRISGPLLQVPLARFPYVVVYAVHEDAIDVVRVFNTKQHPRKKLRRR